MNDDCLSHYDNFASEGGSIHKNVNLEQIDLYYPEFWNKPSFIMAFSLMFSSLETMQLSLAPEQA